MKFKFDYLEKAAQRVKKKAVSVIMLTMKKLHAYSGLDSN